MNEMVIVCVDDHNLILDSLRRQLRRELGSGYRIEIAENGAEALELLAEITAQGLEVPLIISDHVMPSMTGDELLIKVHQSYPQTVKILLTGQASAEAIGNAVNYANLYRYITKPWDKTDLSLTVKEALRRYSQEREILVKSQELEQLNASLEQKVKERTAELKTAKEASEVANQVKSEFLANMSHELKNPLSTILGYAEMLQNSQNLNRQEIKGIKAIYRSGHHLLTFINDILDMSKIDAGKVDISPFDIIFGEFLQGIIEICQIRSEQKGEVALVYKPDRQLPNLVYSDAKRLRQILINLISNAVKFTDRGQVFFKVQILAEWDVQRDTEWDGVSSDLNLGNHLGNSQDPNGSNIDTAPHECENTYNKLANIRFEIVDTGIGIKSEHLEKIFLPFEQVGDRDRNAEGTGLGLAISQKIARVMGSKIEVTSEVGKGSRFWLDLVLPISWGSKIAPNNDQLSAELTHEIVIPPIFELENLLRISTRGNLNEVIRRADRLKKESQEYEQFCQQISDLAQDFEGQALNGLIKHYILRAQAD